jgi:hypothetical protein
MGSMPIVEGAVSDQFGKPLFFALYDWFLEVKPLSFALFLSLQFCHNPCTSAIFMSANKLEIQRSPCKFLTFSESLKMAVISYVCMQHGPVYKLAFGPKAFVVVSDPIVTHHILRENAFGYDKACFKLYVLHTQSQQSHFKDEEQYVHVVVRSFCWTL